MNAKIFLDLKNSASLKETAVYIKGGCNKKMLLGVLRGGKFHASYGLKKLLQRADLS